MEQISELNQFIRQYSSFWTMVSNACIHPWSLISCFGLMGGQYFMVAAGTGEGFFFLPHGDTEAERMMWELW